MTDISPSKMKENQESFVETNEGQNVEQDEEILQHETTTVQEEEKGDESDEKEQSFKKRSLDENHENVIQNGRTEDDQDPKSKKSKLENTHDEDDDDDDDDEKDDTNKSEEVDVPPKSVFGFGSSYTAGFSAFKPSGSTSGFGFGTGTGTGSTTTGFGSGAAPGTLVFGQIGTTNTNGFGSSNTAFKPFTKGFGVSENAEDADAVTMTNTTTAPTTNTTTITTATSVFAKPEISTGETEEPTTFTPIVQLPQTSEEITNGEENEESILSLRAKLFKLTKVVVVAPNVTAQVSSPIQAKVGGIQMATKVGTQIDDSEQTQNQESTVDSADAKMDWKEVGIGPLRILTDDKHVRIVQRRENTPGGQGTKLILNIRLHDECRVERQADKFVKLAAFEAVDASPEEKESAKKFEMVQYLFKVKTVTEGDDLFETLKRYCKTK
jgi:hypothetical protein